MNELAAWGAIFAIPFCYWLLYERVTGRRHPLLQKPEKRTFLFENEDGTEYNPFHSVSEGSEANETPEYERSRANRRN